MSVIATGQPRGGIYARQRRLLRPRHGHVTRVGVQHDSPGETFLIEQGFTQLAPAVDESTSARKLIIGRIDAWFVRQLVATQTARDVGDDDPARLVRGAAWKTPSLYLAGSQAVPAALAERLREALAALRADGAYDRIVNRYR